MTERGIRYGFSLLELLIAITIVFILASMMAATVATVRRSAKRRRAAVEAQALLQAMKRYHTAYGEWPGSPPPGAGDVTFTNCAGVLADLTNNPRGLQLIELGEDDIKNNCRVDPWGRSYVTAVDMDGDGATGINCTNAAGVFVTNVPDKAAVFSWGPAVKKPSWRVYSW
ncbi:MAG: type II secretion system protein [Kiritimatiellia bacterium]